MNSTGDRNRVVRPSLVVNVKLIHRKESESTTFPMFRARRTVHSLPCRGIFYNLHRAATKSVAESTKGQSADIADSGVPIERDRERSEIKIARDNGARCELVAKASQRALYLFHLSQCPGSFN